MRGPLFVDISHAHPLSPATEDPSNPLCCGRDDNVGRERKLENLAESLDSLFEVLSRVGKRHTNVAIAEHTECSSRK
jgi:hypothetical protein